MAKQKKERKNIINGRVYIQVTFNNTIVTVTSDDGNTLCWSSAGSLGFRGVKKSTPYAAQVTTETALQKARGFGLQRVQVFVKGPGSGRETAIKSIVNQGLEVISIHDITPIPFNGCRPKKVRRP